MKMKVVCHFEITESQSQSKHCLEPTFVICPVFTKGLTVFQFLLSEEFKVGFLFAYKACCKSLV